MKNDKRKYPGIIAHLDCDCPRDGRRATFGTMSFELWASAATLAPNSNNFVPNVARDVARTIAFCVLHFMVQFGGQSRLPSVGRSTWSKNV